MIWQDFVLTGTNILFGFMLIPQIKDIITNKHYLNLYTCTFTFIGLCICNITMASLGLWLSATPICTTAWGIILIYSYKNKKVEQQNET